MLKRAPLRAHMTEQLHCQGAGRRRDCIGSVRK